MKLTSFKLNTLFVLSLFTMNLLQAQAPELPKIAPLSPETANLSKFAEVPVSYYTGVPNISIPITTLNGRSISIPVSVNYHAGGHKVTDIASWVGLGWNLNVGGQVYRVMNQLPDDFKDGNGFLTTLRTCGAYEALTDNNAKNNWLNAAIQTNQTDFAPDEFYFNFLGHTGKFMFNQNRTTEYPYGEMVFFPESDVRVEPVFDGYKRIVQWIITTTDGNTFYFGENNAVDRITSTKSYSADHTSLPAEGVAPYSSFAYTTAWKLTKIVTSKNETITFSYDSYTYYKCTPTGESNIMSWSESYSKTSSLTSGSNSVVSEIISENGKIIFNKEASPRLDLGYEYALDNIVLKDKFDKQIEKIDFFQSYFQSTVPQGQTFILCSGEEVNDYLCKRLKLDKIKFYGDTSSTPYEYALEYSPLLLPHRLSKSQDYWGYYNGSNNTTLVPSIFYREYQQPASQHDFFYQGADRTINPSYTQAGMLKRIIYPEGGKTEFEYENNTASGNFSYKNSLNIFEPSLDHSTEINSLNNNNITTVFFDGANRQAYLKNFTVDSPVGYQGRLLINSSSTIWDNTALSGGEYGEQYYNLPISGQDIRFCIRKKNTFGIYDEIVGNSFGVPIGYDPIIYIEPGDYQLQLIFYNVSGGGTNPALTNPSSEEIKVHLDWKIRKFEYRLIGGLRIKSIQDYTYENSTTPSLERSFEYKNPTTGNESGWIVGVPIFKEAIFVQSEGANIRKTKVSSNNLYPLISTQSNYVGYTSVVETRVNDEEEELKNSFDYSFAPPHSSFFGAPTSYEWECGNLTTSISYIEKPLGSIFPSPLPFMYTYIPLKKTYTYCDYLLSQYTRNQVRGLDIYQKAYDHASIGQLKSVYDIFNGLLLKRNSISEELYYDDTFNYLHSLTNTINFSYGNPLIHLNPVVKETSTSIAGETIKEEYIYPEDISDPNSNIQSLITQNKTSTPIIVNSYNVKSPNQIEKSLSLNTLYKNWGNNSILPEFVEISKGDDNLEDRVIYHDYDDYGNPLEVSKADGTHIVYIWGYNDTQPIAKIENASFLQLESAIATMPANFNTLEEIQGLSDMDNDRTVDIINPSGAISKVGREGDLREALRELRSSLPDAMVTTYTYDPLVGVTSVTDPRGQTTYYEYDDFNRLKWVKDAEGNILSENDYNYKN